jgi:LCP family protein required for cell wall assembly
MDDLDLIRDLGRDLEHEPPPSLVRQRNRLLDSTRRRRRVPGRWTLIAVAAAVTAAAIVVPAMVFHGRDANPVATRTTAPLKGRGLNVLLIGSDERGDGYSPLSDTLMMVHVPADRREVRAVSVPRDSLVGFPACALPKGKDVRGRQAPISSIFGMGGATCTEKTLESLTGVRIDQTVVIGFGGFARMVDALGGVRLTLPRPVSIPRSGLRLSAGAQRLTGKQALAYVRARHGFGDGSDLDRIPRQQQFLAAFVREAKERMRANPLWFAKFLALAAGSVETVPKLDAGGLLTLARGFPADASIGFDTVPVHPAPSDQARLVWDQEGAKRTFAPFRS